MYLIFSLLILSKSYANDSKLSEYGNYLSWNYAKDFKDTKNLKFFFKNLNIDKLDASLLEEVFFESVIFDEWTKAEKISSLLLKKNKNNFSANLFKFFIGFLNNREVDSYLEKVEPKYLDLNFINAITIWKNYEKNQDKFFQVKNCVPIICLHSALVLNMLDQNKQAQSFFDKVEKGQFASYRIKELLLLNAMHAKSVDAEKFLNQINSHDLNINNFDLNYFSKNKYLLNPIENKTHGMAEVLYNISSWFFSKDLYKYSAFFGKISLKLRPEFNAMKLLLAGNLEKLGYANLAMEHAGNFDPKNLYLYKFIRTKLSLFEDLKKNQEFLSDLKEFVRKYPERLEMKILLADKLRRLEKYKEAIIIYTEIINNKALAPNWNVLYSRGISYERINEWNKAENDLKEAMRLNPEDAYILNYLAYSWLDRKKNFAQALELLKKAVEIEPSDAYIIDSLGWAFFLTNQTDESINFLEKAVSLLPNDATLNDHLGDAYWKAGRRNEARSQWKRVLILDPKFKKKKIINMKIKKGL